MQELPKGDALRPKALISYRALLEKTASRISTVHTTRITNIIFKSEFPLFYHVSSLVQS